MSGPGCGQLSHARRRTDETAGVVDAQGPMARVAKRGESWPLPTRAALRPDPPKVMVGPASAMEQQPLKLVAGLVADLRPAREAPGRGPEAVRGGRETAHAAPRTTTVVRSRAGPTLERGAGGGAGGVQVLGRLVVLGPLVVLGLVRARGTPMPRRRVSPRERTPPALHQAAALHRAARPGAATVPEQGIRKVLQTTGGETCRWMFRWRIKAG